MEYEIGRSEAVSTAVVRAVSAVVGRRPGDLRPLAQVLDTDALDALFEPRFDGEARTGGRLTFLYSGCHVTVDNGEYIALEPIEVDRRVPG